MRYAVYYQKKMKPFPDAPSFAAFSVNYAFMGIVEAHSLDHLFECMNDPQGQGLNPLGYPHKDAFVLQELTVYLAGHTSMSVGDIAVDMDNGNVMMCVSIGWERCEELSRRCQSAKEETEAEAEGR